MMFYDQKKQILDFGKYNGRSIARILDDDPGYLVWMHENTNHKLSDKLYQLALEFKADSDDEFYSELDTF